MELSTQMPGFSGSGVAVMTKEGGSLLHLAVPHPRGGCSMAPENTPHQTRGLRSIPVFPRTRHWHQLDAGTGQGKAQDGDGGAVSLFYPPQSWVYLGLFHRAQAPRAGRIQLCYVQL